jgi:glycosyltransferase involved in cell wall biosynthesis
MACLPARGSFGRAECYGGLDLDAAAHGRALTRPWLSVAVPTRNRAELLKRALDSVISATASVAERVEVVVSDGSADDASARVVEGLLTGWPGGHRYVSNRPPLSLPGNINRAMGLATGEWILQLHDDDYLLPDAGPAILGTIRRTPSDERVLLFGVEIVDEHGVVHRRQRFRHERHLEPEKALRRVLRDSSFVRQPAAVVHHAAFQDEGWYDATLGSPCDTDMWVRLFSRYGVRCVPLTTCAYTIHQQAATSGMWNPSTIRINREIFDRAVARGVVPERLIRRWEADFFHQFILAGAYRRLRLRQRAEARDVLRLFDLPELRDLGMSPRWLAVRVAFVAATAGVQKRG